MNLTISKCAHLCNFLTAFSALAWLLKEMQSHRQLPLKPSDQIQPTLTRDMEVLELRCSCKFGKNEQLGKGPKLSAQHHPLEPLAAACPAGIGFKMNPGKPWFLRQVFAGSVLPRCTELPWKSQEIPEIQARTSRSSTTLPYLDGQLLTLVPMFPWFLFWACRTIIGRSYQRGLKV